MSGLSLIQSSLPRVALSQRPPQQDPRPTQVAGDEFQQSSPTSAEEGTFVTMRVKVKNSLLQPDAAGKIPLDELEPDLVPKGAQSQNAPELVSALTDPTVPAGYQPVTTVAVVLEEQAQNLEQLNQDCIPAFVPKGSYVLTQADVNEYAQSQQQIGYQRGMNEGVQQGAREAVPAGYQVKLMDSPAGLKVEATRNQWATLVGSLGSTSGALAMAANIGMPARFGAPLALAAAPLQILGPTGTLSTIAQLEHQKLSLIENVKAQNPGREPLQVVVDMNPHTQQPLTLGEALGTMQLLQKTQQLKTVGSVLLLGAGAAAIGGWGGAATALAVGSLTTPLADSLPTFSQLGQTRARSQELKDTLEARTESAIQAGLSPEKARIQAAATSIEVPVPILSPEGQPVGFQSKQIPLSEALNHVQNQQKMLTLGAVGTVAQVGSLVAMGVGCPVMLAVGASVALPLVARGALFPGETWEGLKALPGLIQEVIEAIGRRFGLVQGVPAQAEAGPMTEAQKQLLATLTQIANLDPHLAQGLQSTLEALHRAPRNEAEQNAATEAAPRHQALLAQLKEKAPALEQQFQASMQALVLEASQAQPQPPAPSIPQPGRDKTVWRF